MDRHGSDSVVDPSVRQLLIGKDGSDILVGGNENDILVAGLGNQQLTGGGGRDQFVLSQGGIQARVTDFTPGQDRLVFEQALTRDQLTQGLSIS
ncbi:MAG: calcium-binding protein, partial [Synechococcaceae bacterium WB6_3B_236]|nr:calcium-binding protein [Synechococcaceae bacterium WB6_3B_236]